MISVAMMGSRRDYQVPLILAQRGLLDRFFTDFYIGNKPWLRRALATIPGSLKPASVRRMETRYNPALPPEKVLSFDWEGIRASAVAPRKRNAMLWEQSSVRFCKNVVRAGFSTSSGIYAANGSALEIFEAARPLGIRCLLEYFSAPADVYQNIVDEEEGLWPGWDAHLQGTDVSGFSSRAPVETELADCIFCPSDFVRDLLIEKGVSRSKCLVLPYAFEPGLVINKQAANSNRDGGLKVLFVGGVRIAKGVQYLLQALKHLNDNRISCCIVGEIFLDRKRVKEFEGIAQFTGPLSRAGVAEMYQWADVFVLPTLCEGSAVVNYEALGCGLPVITTTNAGSVVRDGLDGFVVPIRDANAIAKCLGFLLDHPEQRKIMSANARTRAREFTLAAYGDRLITALQNIEGVVQVGAQGHV